MRFGTYLFEPKKVPGFDFDLFRVKPEVGRRQPPQPDMYSNVAIFGDNVTVRNHPEWVSQSEFGPALRTNDRYNFRWDILCHTVPEFRGEMLNYIEDVDRGSQGVWLNSIHFADHGHCTCHRCKEKWQKSGLSWLEWRKKEVTEYIAQVRERVKKELVIGLLPDPVCSYERFGIDFDALAPYADAFNVVMFSKNYATPWYWEMLSRAFKKLLKKPLYISLYVFGPGDDPKEVPSPAELLTVSVRCGRAGVDGILYLADKASQIVDFQKAAVDKVELRQKLKNYGCPEVLELVERWEQIVE
jgi:glycosyltransferase involved in cell wall biosynthesis